MDTIHQWLSLAFTPGLGPASLKKLVQRFGSARQILAAGRKALEECSFLRKESLASLCDQKTIAAAADRELRLAEKAGTVILCWDDPLFPPLLKEINDPPVILHVLGSPRLLSAPGIAMVGARAASSYGLQVAERLATELAGQDLVITSGFALGIDAAAHRGALAAAGGKTVAVMGCGLDIVYPSQNKKLHGQIAAHGAIISESPLGTLPEGFRFPARNRIISGLSLGVVVVEAAHRSGTLITAHQALEQGRDVFAVPGRIDSPKSEGCHRLIQEGAKLVHNAADILEELPLTAPASPPATRPLAPPLPGEEGKIFSLLEVYPRNIEEIILASQLPPHRISEILLHLELRGLVASLPGKQYQRLAEPHSSSV